MASLRRNRTFEQPTFRRLVMLDFAFITLGVGTLLVLAAYAVGLNRL
jgi:hypothetical protein